MGRRITTRDRFLTPEEAAKYAAIRETFEREELPQLKADLRRDAAELKSMGAAIRAARESQGVSVEELAQQAGIDPILLANIEEGRQFDCSIGSLQRLSHLLGKGFAFGFVDLELPPSGATAAPF